MGRIVRFRRRKSMVREVQSAVVVGIFAGLLINQYLPSIPWETNRGTGGFIDSGSAGWRNAIIGPADVIDGDTLSINNQRIRLQGIDAPELSQNCTRNGSLYPCGYEARRSLENIIAGRPVTCQSRDNDKYGRAVAKCFVGQGIDLNARMVERGQAVAYLYFSRDYAAEQSRAEAAGRGIWKGEFLDPYEYRRQGRDLGT